MITKQRLLPCIVAAALLWLAAPSAMAQPTTTLPPAKYDVPFRGALTIWRTESVEQNGRFRAAYIFAAGKTDSDNYAGWQDVAFASTPAVREHGAEPGDCQIFIVKDDVLKTLGWSLAVVLRHELGHCNGWPADHPGGKSVPTSLRLPMPELPPGTRWLPTVFLNGR